MEKQCLSDIKLGNYSVSIELQKAKKSLYFKATDYVKGLTYDTQWKDSSLSWKQISQLYCLIVTNTKKSITLIDQSSSVTIWIIQKYRVVLKNEVSLGTNYTNQFSDIPYDKQKFIYQAAIHRNLYINDKLLIKSFPYNTIGLIYGPDEEWVGTDKQTIQTQQIHIGTGCLVGPGLVLTCAHSVFYKNKQNWKKSFKRKNLKFKLKNRQYKIVDMKISQYYAQERRQQFYRRHDYSLLLLDSIQMHTQFLPLCVDYIERCKAIVYGYPASNYPSNFNKHEKTEFKQAGSLDYAGWIQNGFLYYDITTTYGQSGSPVWTDIYNKTIAIGIHICYSQSKNKNVALHLNKKRIDQILIWKEQLTNMSKNQQIQVYKPQDLKRQNSIIEKPKKKIDLSKLKLDILIIAGTNCIRNQNYGNAVQNFDKARQICQQKVLLLMLNVNLLQAIAHRKNQIKIDLKRYNKKIQNNKKAILSQNPRDLNKQYRKQRKYNRKQNKYMKKIINQQCQLNTAEDLVHESLQIVKIYKQNNHKLLIEKLGYLDFIKKQSMDPQAQKQFLPYKIQLETQMYPIQHQQQRSDLQWAIFNIEMANIYLASKNFKESEDILDKLQNEMKQTLKESHFSILFQQKYSYLLGLVSKKKIKKDVQTSKKVKRQCFELYYKKQLQLDQFGKKLIKSFENSKSYYNFFQVLLQKDQNQYSQLVVICLRTITIMQQYVLANENQLQQQVIICELLQQMSQIFIERKDIEDLLLTGLRNIIIPMANKLDKVQQKKVKK